MLQENLLCVPATPMTDPWPPFLRACIQKSLQLWIRVSCNSEASLSRTWEPFLWNVIIKKDEASLSPVVWEDRMLTWVSASYRLQTQLASSHLRWPMLCTFTLPWLYTDLIPLPFFPFIKAVTVVQVRMDLSSFPSCQQFLSKICFRSLNESLALFTTESITGYVSAETGTNT